MDSTRWFSEDTEVGRLKGQLQRKDIDYSNLRAELDQRNAELDAIKLLLRESQHELSTQTNKYTDLEDASQRSFKDLQKEREARQSLAIALETLEEKHRSTEKSLYDVQRELEYQSMHSSGVSGQVEKLAKERDALKARIRELETERAKVVEVSQPPSTDGQAPLTSSAPTPGGASARPATRPRSSSCDFRLTNMESELGELREALEKAQAHAALAQEKASKATAEALRATNAHAAAEHSAGQTIKTLRSELDDATYDREEMRMELERYDEEQAAMKIELDANKALLDEAVQRARAADGDLIVLRAEVDRLKTELAHEALETVKMSLAAANGELANKQRKLDELQHAFQGIRADVATLEDDKRRLKAALATAQASSTAQPPIQMNTLALSDSLPTASTPSRSPNPSQQRGGSMTPLGDVTFTLDDLSTSTAKSPNATLTKSITPPSTRRSMLRLSRSSSTAAFDQAQIEVILEAIERIRTERDQLRQKVYFIELEMKFGATPQAIAKDQRIEQLEQDLERLRKAAGELVPKSDDRMEDLASSLSKNEDIADLQDRIEDMSEEAERRSLSLDEAHQQIGFVSQQLQTTEAQRMELLSEVGKLQERLQAAQQELQHARANVIDGPAAPSPEPSSEQEARIQRREAQIGMHQHELARLKSQLEIAEDSLEDIHQELDKTQTERDKAVEDLAKAQEELDDCRRERDCLLEDSKTVRADREEANKRVEALEDEKDDLEGKLSAEETKVEEIQRSRDVEVTTLVGLVMDRVAKARALRFAEHSARQDDLDENLQYQADLEIQVSSLKKSLRTREDDVTRLQNSESHLSSVIDESRREVSHLREELEAAKSYAKDYTDLLIDNEELKRANVDLRTSIDGHVCPTDQLADLKDQVQTLESQLTSERTDADKQYSTLRDDLDTTKMDLAETKQQLSEYKMEYDALSAEHEKELEDLQHFERVLSEVEASKTQLQDQLDKQTEELDVLRCDFHEADSQVGLLETRVKELEDLQGKTEEEKQELENDLQNLYDAEVRRTNELQEQRSAHEVLVRSLENMAEGLRNTNSQLTEKMHVLEKELEDKALESEQCRHALEEAEARHSASNKEAARIVAELKQEIIQLQDNAAKRPRRSSSRASEVVDELKERVQLLEIELQRKAESAEEADDKLLEIMKERKKLQTRVDTLMRQRDHFKSLAESANPVKDGNTAVEAPVNFPSSAAPIQQASPERSRAAGHRTRELSSRTQAAPVPVPSENTPPATAISSSTSGPMAVDENKLATTTNAAGRLGARLLNIGAVKSRPLGLLRRAPTTTGLGGSTSSGLRTTASRPVLRSTQSIRLVSASSTETLVPTPTTAEPELEPPKWSPSNPKKRAREEEPPTSPVRAVPVIADSQSTLPARLRRPFPGMTSARSGGFTPTRGSGVKDMIARIESNSPERVKSPELPPFTSSTTVPLLNFRPTSPGKPRTRLGLGGHRPPR